MEAGAPRHNGGGSTRQHTPARHRREQKASPRKFGQVPPTTRPLAAAAPVSWSVRTPLRRRCARRAQAGVDAGAVTPSVRRLVPEKGRAAQLLPGGSATFLLKSPWSTVWLLPGPTVFFSRAVSRSPAARCRQISSAPSRQITRRAGGLIAPKSSRTGRGTPGRFLPAAGARHACRAGAPGRSVRQRRPSEWCLAKEVHAPAMVSRLGGSGTPSPSR